MLLLDPVGLHWLGSPPWVSDLCLHGGVRVVFEGDVLLSSDEEDYAVSTGALHLLRTTNRGHTRADPVAQHSVPHCGHFMVVDQEIGRVANVGCSSGPDWWVQQVGEEVILDFHTRVIHIGREEWTRAVARFSDVVRAFYDGSAEKAPSDDLGQEWYPVFREEWRVLRAGVDPRAGRPDADGT